MGTLLHLRRLSVADSFVNMDSDVTSHITSQPLHVVALTSREHGTHKYSLLQRVTLQSLHAVTQMLWERGNNKVLLL